MQKTAQAVHIESDNAYKEFETVLAFRVRGLQGPLFTTADAQGTPIDNLFNTYLEHLPNNKQHYNCHACRRFVNRYGSIVQYDNVGRLISPLWSDSGVPSFFRPAVMAMYDRLACSKINGVFLTEEQVWGQPLTGQWTHLSGVFKKPYKGTLLDAHQKMAELQQDYILLFDSINQYTPAVLTDAMRVMEGDHLPSVERALVNARWFHDLLTKAKDLKGVARSNLVWSFVAVAPTGFVHFKNGMLGTLLDDIKAGLDFAAIKAKWNEKMHPLQYQRPQAPPSAGTIRQAEDAFEKLGLGPSLQRKFARFEEIKTLWIPEAVEYRPPDSGLSLFGRLRPKETKIGIGIQLPPQVMTWAKFQKDVLPLAKKIEYLTPAFGMRDNFFAFVSAMNPESKPLLRWDTEPRNTVSSFVYIDGSTAAFWHLPIDSWVEVTGIARNPLVWYHEFEDVHPGVSFMLKGAHLSTHIKGSAIFPEDVRGDLHGIRSVIEAHSNANTILSPIEGTANGIRFSKNDGRRSRPFTLRVNGRDKYILDRWE